MNPPSLAHVQTSLHQSLQTLTQGLDQLNQWQTQQEQEPQLRPAHILCCHQCPRRHDCPAHRTKDSSTDLSLPA